MTKEEKEILIKAIGLVSRNHKGGWSCTAIYWAGESAAALKLRQAYTDFYGQDGNVIWFTDEEKTKVPTKSQRLLMLALFLVAEGKL